MAGFWVRNAAASARNAIARVHGRSTTSFPSYRQISTSSSMQIIATSEASTSVNPSLHIANVEQMACTRASETDLFHDIDVSQSASQHFGTSEDILPVSSDDVNASAAIRPSSIHNNNDANRLLNILATTTSASHAWDAYEHFRMLESYGHAAYIPISSLHRLYRLLSQTKPRTRSLFLRLLSVVFDLHKRGSPMQLWQWNALIDCAGKGWRKTRPEDFKNALDILEDMTAQKAPGAVFFKDDSELYEPSMKPTSHQIIVPDIVTYTTLINIAGRTGDEQAVRHAMSLLKKSGLTPNRITYLSLIRHFTRARQLSSVCDMLQTMKHEGAELGLDGVNACIWAYGYNGRLDIASTIYRVLRHQYLPEDLEGTKAVEDAVRRLSASEAIDIPSTLIPDAITYHTLIQVYAYHGDFSRSIRTFIDMISFPDHVNVIADRAAATSPTVAGIGSPTLAAYRAIFLGFARHGQLSPGKTQALSMGSWNPSPWNEANLYTLFHTFLRLPKDAKPSERTIYWLLMGFYSTLGQPDTPERRTKLRHIWEHLETKFGGGWQGRLERLRKEIYQP